MLAEFIMVLGMTEKQEITSEEKYSYILKAMYLADSLGYKAVIASNFGWPVFCIDLPTGKIFWGLPKVSEHVYDVSTKEKSDRIRKFAESYQ